MSDNFEFSRRSVLGAAGLTMAGGIATPVAADHDTSTGAQFPEDCDGPGFNDTPRLPDSPWQVHDPCRPQPPAVDPGTPTYPDPPENATVLIGDGDDGQISLDDWNDAESWTVEDGYVVVGDEFITSKEDFGDGHYHVEWQTPESVTGSGQTPGNSGFFLASRYEIQILNNYENPTYADGYAGSVYGQHPPLVNASIPKGEWNTYDVIWRAPRFADDGSLESPGVVTVFWNDVLVQAQTVLNGPTVYQDVAEYTQHPVEAPIQLQDHGQPVRFRNVWYQPDPTPESVLEFDDDQLTVESDTTSTIEASAVNEYDSEMTNGDVTLTPQTGSDVTATSQGGTSFDSLAAGASQAMSWEVTRPEGEDGPHLLNAAASFTVGGEAMTTDFQVPVYPQPTNDVVPGSVSLTKTQVASANNAMKMDVAPDGRVFFTERGQNFSRYPDEPTGNGTIRVYDPETGETTTALEIDVHTGVEEGAQGIVLDPDFEENGWIYFFYDPSNEAIADTQQGLESLDTYQQSPSEAAEGPQPYDLVSRFTVDGNTIDPASETEIIRIPAQRERCCHVGGALSFDNDGNLLITTGDGTDPFESSGYTPIDEREGRAFFDAQRTSANTNDLRGSLLRITPQDDGGYTVPDGNLFTGDEYAQAREDGLVKTEIYGMGFRNPFTMTVDEETGVPYIADYGPDAGSWNAERGPPGITEWVRVDEPGFYGWPYFTGMNVPYRDYDFATGESGDPFDPDNPRNDSPNNDGLTELPPAQPATITNPYSWGGQLLNNVPEYAQEYVPDQIPYPLDGTDAPTGGSPMAGELYNYQDDFDSEVALPRSYDGAHIIMERRGWFKTVSYDDDGSVSRIGPFDLSGSAPMMLHTAPDGSLYLLEYGGLQRVTAQEQADVDPISAPFGYDAGGELLDGTVTIDGLEFSESSPAVQVSNQGANSPAQFPDAEVEGTDNDLLYKTEQWGENLSYDIAVENGTYDLTLYFAEMAPHIRDTDQARVMNVSVQGQTVLEDLNLYEQYGFRTAFTKTVTVTVTDETLSITMSDPEENSKLSGFDLRPADLDPVSTPFGYDAGGELIDGTVTIDGVEYVDSSPSVLVSNTGSSSPAAEPDLEIEGTENDDLYRTEDWGENLTYQVGVEDGYYDVTLYLSENVFSDPDGQQRVINASVEGEQVIEELNLREEVGFATAYTKTVRNVHVTDGLLSIEMSDPVENSKMGGFAITEVSTEVPTEGLVGQWQFDEEHVDGDTVMDASGNDHAGNIVGGVTTGVDAPSIPGDGAEFNGEDGTVLVPDDGDALDPAAYTVSTWIKTDGTDQFSVLVGKNESMWAGTGENGDQPRFDPDDNNSTGESFLSSVGVADGEWHHVVYRHAPGEDVSEIYVDGEMTGSQSGHAESTDSDAPLGIASKSDISDYLTGTLADVRLYDRPLSGSEILGLYQYEGDTGGGSEGIDPATTIELEGTSGNQWVGVAPSSIEGQTNPTLTLREGAEYTLTWTNTGGIHNIHLIDSNGDTVQGVQTETISSGSQTVTFTATEEIAEYVCDVHLGTMRGAVEIVEGDTGGDGPPAVVGDSRPTDPDGDGLYEDINGDGEATYADVVDLFENFDSSAVQDNPDAFDFNGNGRLDYDDIIALFRSL